MHSPARLLVPALAAASLLLSACVKPVEEIAHAEKSAPAPDAFAPPPTAASQPPTVAGIPAAAIAAARRANAKVTAASTDTVNNGVVFNQAKALFAEKKYAESLRALDTLQRELLTPAQEKAVDDLRAQLKAKLGQ